MTPEEATKQLFEAAKSGNLEAAKGALAADADPNAKDDDRQTPLHWAAENGHTDLAALLIEKGADLNNEWRRTPPHWAARTDHTDLVKRLQDAPRDQEGHDWARTDHTDLVKRLQDAPRDQEGHDWARTDHTDLVKRLQDAPRDQEGHAARVAKRRKRDNDEPQVGD